MGRPITVTDDEIIEAGKRLSMSSPNRIGITGHRLWTECGLRGRPRRLLQVWEQHLATAGADGERFAVQLLPLPTEWRRHLDKLLTSLSAGLDQAVQGILASHAAEADARIKAERDHSAAEIEALVDEQRSCEETMDVVASEMTGLREQVAALEQLVVDARKAQYIAEQMHRRDADLLSAAQMRLADLETSRADARAVAAAATAREAMLAHQVGAMQAQCAATQDALDMRRHNLGVAAGRIEELVSALAAERSARAEQGCVLQRTGRSKQPANGLQAKSPIPGDRIFDSALHKGANASAKRLLPALPFRDRADRPASVASAVKLEATTPPVVEEDDGGGDGGDGPVIRGR